MLTGPKYMALRMHQNIENILKYISASESAVLFLLFVSVVCIMKMIDLLKECTSFMLCADSNFFEFFLWIRHFSTSPKIMSLCFKPWGDHY